MLAVAVIEPHTEEAGIYKDVDPENGHEEKPSYIMMGHAQELTLGKATIRCLNPHKESSLK